MPSGLHKPLVVSVLLHAVAFGAAVWTLASILPHRGAGPVETVPSIILTDLSNPAVPNSHAVLPRGTPLDTPTPPMLDAPDVSWPVHPSPVQPTQASAQNPVAWQPTQFASPIASGHPTFPAAAGPSSEGDVIANGTGAGSHDGSTVSGLPYLSSNGIATASAAATGSNPWGSSGPVLLPGSPDPVYPEAQRRHHTEGVTRIRMTVTEDGHAKNVLVIQSSGSEALDQSAMAAARQQKFKPVGTGSSEVNVEQDFHFSLQ